MKTKIANGWKVGIARMRSYFEKVKEKHKEIVKTMKATTKEVGFKQTVNEEDFSVLIMRFPRGDKPSLVVTSFSIR